MNGFNIIWVHFFAHRHPTRPLTNDEFPSNNNNSFAKKKQPGKWLYSHQLAILVTCGSVVVKDDKI